MSALFSKLRNLLSLKVLRDMEETEKAYRVEPHDSPRDMSRAIDPPPWKRQEGRP